MAGLTVLRQLRNYGRLVMFSHSIFSLPFGMLSMIWAVGGLPDFRIFIWILMALLGARNGANAFNRIADRYIDKKNVRTAWREIPSGKVSLWEAWMVTLGCFALMAFAAWQLNWLCLVLMPFALALFVFYSYSKRLTWLCHFILGVCCGGAPVGAWIAATGRISVEALGLGAAVTFWVAGFDIIYATQDIEFDRAQHLHAIPARFGLRGGLLFARASHAVCLAFLLFLYFYAQRGPFYLMGVAAAAVLLFIEHYNVVPDNRKKMILASYSINQILSVTFFVFAMLDYFIKWRIAA